MKSIEKDTLIKESGMRDLFTFESKRKDLLGKGYLKPVRLNFAASQVVLNLGFN